MTPAQVVVTLVGVALAVGVNVYFFAPVRGRRRRVSPPRPPSSPDPLRSG